ncbi:hypothetical protein CAP36_01795 [Chitinophagaceae bacterium IBVUCB2]|nr:hypothetical protein CAP36_01795 [Chitinophagaceae bacterium IBVUCB2]
MKRIILPLFVIIATLSFNFAKAQNSCPEIVFSSFRILTDDVNPCLRSIRFDFVNPTSGAKMINLVVRVGTTVLLDECIDASGQNNVTRTHNSASFTLCDLNNLEVKITPYTGSNCTTGTSACGPTVRSIGGAPLPVTFSSFSASRVNTSVQLKWETTTEINNSGFTIERNTGSTWEKVAVVASKSADGNSTEKLSYQYTDINTTKGMSQYRIKQTDFDGQSKYSEVRAIRGQDQVAKTTVYPNPAVDGRVNVVFADASARNIVLVDMAGRTIKQWNKYTGNSLQVSDVAPGMYSIRISNLETGDIASEKLIMSAR